MDTFKETLTDLKEKFEKAQKLIEEESKNDPITEPYKSHYSAQNILTEMAENLRNLLNSMDIDYDRQLIIKSILGFIYQDLGKIAIFTDEAAAGEKHLHNCLELLEEYKMRPEAVIVYLDTLNELGILWSTRQNPTLSKEFLDKAENLYNEFKITNIEPMTIWDLFGTRDEVEIGKGNKELEKIYTLTTFYMAQVLGYLGEPKKSALYCYTTLKRQLEANEYEHIDWALNAATLSQFYLLPNYFSIARHHLAASIYMLSIYEKDIMNSDVSAENDDSIKDNFKHRYADVARCWAKYGLALLRTSIERLMQDKEENQLNEEIAELEITKEKIQLRFETLDVSAYENGISDQYCLTLDDAKLVYHFVIMWLERAKDYYTSDTEATEYSKIIMDYVELYKHMAFFDDIPSNQCKLHKKRIDELEALLALLNKNYYLSICRQCWYECGLAYSCILEIKLDALNELKPDEKPTPHALNKVNNLCNKGIKYFTEFYKSYIEKNTDKLINNISLDELHGVLYSFFYIGRLFYKIITPDRNMQLNNLQNSLKYYKRFVNECEERKDIIESFKSEVGVCKEMVTLLPLKIQKISTTLNN